MTPSNIALDEARGRAIAFWVAGDSLRSSQCVEVYLVIQGLNAVM